MNMTTEHELSRPVQLNSIEPKGWQDEVVATAEEREALAKRFALLHIETLSAQIGVMPQKGGLIFHVTGDITATLTQESVISGDAVTSDMQMDIDAWYSDQSRIASFDEAKRRKDNEKTEDEKEIQSEKDDPEPLYDGALDLGEVIAQFFGLALEDYPRDVTEQEGTGDYIEAEPGKEKPNPFAKLAELKEK